VVAQFGGESCGAGTDSHVVWFKWEATVSVSEGVFATTLNSSYDTVL
jgi:hypothetical protein